MFSKENCVCLFLYWLTFIFNRIGSVIVSILASSAVDRGFQLRPIETKDYEIGLFSSKHSLESG